MDETAILAAMAAVIAFCLGYVIGGRGEARYWADHADNGDICHAGVFYRITKKIGQRNSAQEPDHG